MCVFFKKNEVLSVKASPYIHDMDQGLIQFTIDRISDCKLGVWRWELGVVKSTACQSLRMIS